ncbi:MAG: TonB-dependent receptor [Pseudomonadales bacterium]|nr:TonB-dependent receptor [Pseudomonadales bacterium]
MPTIASAPKYRTSVLALAIAATGGIALPASAQSERAGGLEEILVTAQRREESLQDTPIAITAFTTDKLNDLGIYDVSQLGDFAPNLLIQKQPSSNSNMNIVIRGMSQGETSLLADPKVGFYIDGVYMSKTVGAVFDVVDLERVEVLRGPQGTLFGRNSTGGAVNVTTRKPSGELGLKAEASAGNFGYTRYGASLDLPAVANVAAKLAFNRMQTDGWADNDYRGTPQQPATNVEENLASEDNQSYRIALRWTPRDDLSFDYAYDNTDNNGVPAPFQIVKVKDSLYNGFTTTPADFQLLGGALFQQMAATVGDPKERRDDYELDAVTDEWLEVKGHTFIAEWQATDDLAFKYIYGKRKTDSGYGSTDLDGGAYLARDLFYGSLAGNDNPVPAPGFNAAIDEGLIDMDSHELQLIGSALDERLNYTAGLFYYEEDVSQDNPQTLSIPIEFMIAGAGAGGPALRNTYNTFGYCPPAFGGACIGSQRLPVPSPFAGDPYIPGLMDFYYGQSTESWAAYGQTTYDITEQLELTLGLRYTEDEKEAFLYNQNISGYTKDDPIVADDKWDNLSYKANLNYALTDDIGVYLTYATGYNGGGFNARASNIDSFTTPFAEEEVETWELGLKSEWWDNRVRFNAAIFTNDYTDIQIAQFEAGSGGASSRIVNAGQGTYQGIEFDLVVVPVEGLTIDMTYGYLDAEFDEYEARNPATNQLEDISDVTEPAQTPENSASLGVQYDFEPFSFGALSARVDVAYKDEFTFHPFNNQFDSTDDRTLVNGRLSLNEIKMDCCEKGAVRVSLWGKNLTDEEYRNWGIDFSSLGFAGNVYGEPRTYGLDVVYTYQ